MFAEIANAITLVTGLLEEEEFYIRFNAMELLSAMVGNCPELIVSTILTSPNGVSRFVDLLNDSRDIIRNDALLLLIALSRSSEELSKILTFENIFDKLFTIINLVKNPLHRTEDDMVDAKEDALLVHDCLQLLYNLIRSSSSNRAYFREAGCIPRLADIFCDPSIHATLIEDDYRNQELALSLVSCLTVSTDADVETNQYLCAKCGVVEKANQLAFGQGVPNSVRVIAMGTIVTLIHNCSENREAFASFATQPQILTYDFFCSDQSSALRSASYLLLREMVSESKGSSSSAFLNCLVNIALPTDPSTELTWMRELASKIKISAVGWPAEGVDGGAVFYSCQLLEWVIQASITPKLARARLLEAKVGKNHEGLLSKCTRSLNRAMNEGGPAEVRIGLLKLLCVWLYKSPEAIAAFLSSAMNLPLLIELINRQSARGDRADVHEKGLSVLVLANCLGIESKSSTVPRSTIIDIVRNRVGITNFTARYVSFCQ